MLPDDPGPALLYLPLTLQVCLIIILGGLEYSIGLFILPYRTQHMNALVIFVVRLILGLVFGILLTRLFKPDWGVFHGAVTGLILVGLAYGIAFFKQKK